MGGRGCRKHITCPLGARDEVVRHCHRLFDAVPATNDVECTSLLASVERPAEHPPQFVGSSATPGERVHHRKRVDTFDHVVTCGLAELGIGRGEVENVVDNLEDHAVCRAVRGECVDDRAIVTGNQSTDASRSAVQRRGLAFDTCQVRLDRPRRVVGEAQFLDLALAQTTNRARKQTGDLGSERRRDFRRPREKKVTGENRLQVAPLRIDRLDTATRLGLVHDVVVVQRTQVDEFTGDSALNRVIRRGCGFRLGRQAGHNRHDGTQTLAARRYEV